jgi:two-component system nitrogen regulation response regulator NtrX
MARDILIVDDEADIRELISGILHDEGYTTRTAADADTAIAEIDRRRPTLVILDIWLQGSRLDGLEVLEWIKGQHASLPVVVISGHGTIETAVAAIKKGAYDFIEKPFKTDRLLLQLERAIEAAKLKQENLELRLRAGGETALIGHSPAIGTLRQAIERVAPANSRVLIFGPSGSGKEVVARLLHAHSRRSDSPFVVVNAAAMAPERMESELFGVEGNGSAEQHKVGTCELAHGGTLFLDEVADMPRETQAKILRFLTDQSFERVGGRVPVEVDVRVISATSRDLVEEHRAGRFRQDLLDRLNVVPLKVPALKERREDIPELCRYFMQREAQAQGLPPRAIGEDAMALLQAAPWPGNVRELRNIIARLLIMAPGDPRLPISVDMLPAELSADAPAILHPGDYKDFMALPLKDAREVFEREYLMSQIVRFGGNISRTATFVGMERSALHRKLKSLGVSSGERSAELNG